MSAHRRGWWEVGSESPGADREPGPAFDPWAGVGVALPNDPYTGRVIDRPRRMRRSGVEQFGSSPAS